MKALVPTLSIAIPVCLALAAPTAIAKSKCESLTTDTVVSVSGAIKKVRRANGEVLYDIDGSELPCDLDKFDSALVHVSLSSRLTCRVGQVMTASGPSNHDPGFMGVGFVDIRPTEFSCR
jgi:hypothetical protein